MPDYKSMDGELSKGGAIDHGYLTKPDSSAAELNAEELARHTAKDGPTTIGPTTSGSITKDGSKVSVSPTPSLKQPSLGM